MSDALTVDASVFVNAFSPTETGSEQSWRFLAQLLEAGIPVFVPTLMLVEVVASLARRQNNTALALEWMETIQKLNSSPLSPWMATWRENPLKLPPAIACAAATQCTWRWHAVSGPRW